MLYMNNIHNTLNNSVILERQTTTLRQFDNKLIKLLTLDITNEDTPKEHYTK